MENGNGHTGRADARILVYGAGGQGAVVVDLLRALGWQDRQILVFDDDPDIRGLLGLPTLGEAECPRPGPGLEYVLVAIGRGTDRWAVAEQLRSEGWRSYTAIHPAATVSPDATVGPGTVVCAGAIVGPRAQVGTDCIINSGAIVEHDCVVGDTCHVASGAVLGGGVELRPMSLVGSGATVLPGLHLPGGVTVGAGAVVTRADWPEEVTLTGVPARVRK